MPVLYPRGGEYHSVFNSLLSDKTCFFLHINHRFDYVCDEARVVQLTNSGLVEAHRAADASDLNMTSLHFACIASMQLMRLLMISTTADDTVAIGYNLSELRSKDWKGIQHYTRVGLHDFRTIIFVYEFIALQADNARLRMSRNIRSHRSQTIQSLCEQYSSLLNLTENARDQYFRHVAYERAGRRCERLPKMGSRCPVEIDLKRPASVYFARHRPPWTHTHYLAVCEKCHEILETPSR